MNAQAAELDLLASIENRHNDLLVRLDELDKRIERTLAECQVYRVSPSSSDRGGQTY